MATVEVPHSLYELSPTSELSSSLNFSPTTSQTPPAISSRAEKGWKWWRKQRQVRIRVKIPRKRPEREIERVRGEEELESECGCCHCCCDGSGDSTMSEGNSEADGREGADGNGVSSGREPAGQRKKVATTDDSWTLVAPKRGKETGTRAKKNKKRSSRAPEARPAPSALVSSTSKDRAVRRINNARPKLANQLHKYSEDLMQTLSQLTGAPLAIDRVIIIGLGNLDDETEREPRRAALQMALLLELLTALRLVSEDDSAPQSSAVPEISVPCYAQDPAFTLTDISVLEHFGIKSLPHPHGSDLISPSTLVFAPFVDVTVLMPCILRDKSPAVYVGVGFDAFIDGIGSDPLFYAEKVDVEEDLAKQTLEQAKVFSTQMEKVDVNMNMSKKGSELDGLSMWIRK